MLINDPPKDLVGLSYGLVLLQEICQGYDNPSYRSRARKFIAGSSNMYISNYLLPHWLHNWMSTQEFMHKIEENLLGLAATGCLASPGQHPGEAE